jgi:hypothetical protein
MLAGSLAAGVPGVGAGMRSVASLLAEGSAGGPGPELRARTRSVIVAEAGDRSGRLLGDVRLEGIDPYELTAVLLAWGAETARAGGLRGSGALGPIDALGLDALETALADLGLARV